MFVRLHFSRCTYFSAWNDASYSHWCLLLVVLHFFIRFDCQSDRANTHAHMHKQTLAYTSARTIYDYFSCLGWTNELNISLANVWIRWFSTVCSVICRHNYNLTWVDELLTVFKSVLQISLITQISPLIEMYIVTISINFLVQLTRSALNFLCSSLDSFVS